MFLKKVNAYHWAYLDELAVLHCVLWFYLFLINQGTWKKTNTATESSH